ncbi:uncharacterized protein [Acropora muricata]|uniref:uncharacterized protein n=2 Tax=Acropora TaxID=6127 RepID=UPI0034E42143
MGQCFAPDCNHQSESHTCKFFLFPNPEKKKDEYRRWIRLLRRADREPSKYSKVCSCHFREGKKSSGPEIFKRNADKLFPLQENNSEKKRKCDSKVNSSPVNDIMKIITEAVESSEKTQNGSTQPASTEQIILEAELHLTKQELKYHNETKHYQRAHYSVSALSPEVIRMETGLPTKEIFNIVVDYVAKFKHSISYYAGWKVESITFEDQIFITLMKLRQNYTNLHLAQLFSCSVGTISNIVITFVHVLHRLLFEDLMTTIPSRNKNKLCSPSSFSQYSSCRIIIDCTDIEVATPSLMSQQNATYSSYRGMNSFKVLTGVAPNGVLTYVSNLYPGSISDKSIVQQSGLLKHFVAGDLILADKGFLIQDIVPNGVSVNIPPFLEHGRFTESEAKVTKSIARCRIHVERANARLKDFKILSFVPPYLRSYVDTVFQLCAAIVNLQFPLIKEGCEGTRDFD